MTLFFINGEIHSSKNSRVTDTRTGRTFKSKAAKADEKMFAEQLLVQKSEWEKTIKGLSFPLYIGFYFMRKTRRKWDFANLVQGLSDAMVKAGYLPDDDVEHFIPVYNGHEVSPRCPGVIFKINE